MSSHSAREILMSYIPLADGIAQTFGQQCEVVLHDLTAPQSSVIYAANPHVSGREAGQSFHQLITQVLLSKKLDNDVVAGYKTTTEDGRTLKSTTVLIRNIEQAVIGALCIHYDIEPFKQMQQILADLTYVEEPTTAEETELFGHVSEIADQLIGQIVKSEDAEQMDRSRKIEIIASMDEKGVFLIKGAIDKVAEALKISKVTVYSYLDEVRQKE
ncbi:transcriptional regulator [Paenibacillus sp. GCM10027626]|uniref:helix-turn-helix transcriptional regulator n=1 Tax=Paenibacillus sp. GCM10027626 TaxID=3273411 RepID=UPI00362A099B